MEIFERCEIRKFQFPNINLQYPGADPGFSERGLNIIVVDLWCTCSPTEAIGCFYL